MFAKTFKLLAVLFCVVAMVGCEGEQGPAGAVGPEGPPGPSVVICMGEINGEVNPPTVVSSYPSEVTVTPADVVTGIWDVTLTGTFPSTEGTVLTTNVDTYASRSLTGYITSWSTTSIVFRVGIWNTLGDAFVIGEFSFVVLGEPL